MKDRIRLAWNVLRGRPTAYRIKTQGIEVSGAQRTMVYGCTITGAPGYGINVRPPGGE